MKKETKNRYEKWLNSDFLKKEEKEELESIKNYESEIEERFYKELEFGTGGLRGIIGIGTNRINEYTIGMATQGLADYILKNKPENKNGVVIAYDSRRKSPEFADTAACVLAGNGIKAYVFDILHATPLLSYAVRYLNAVAGIVITASHNPPEYNGYKAYWADGAQVVHPHDTGIIEEVRKIYDYNQVKVIEKKAAEEKGLYIKIENEIDDAYHKDLLKTLNSLVNIDESKELRIVYTPLHGTGYIPVKTALNNLGFVNYEEVSSQTEPDSEFSTVGYPNPEDFKVFKLGVEKAEKVQGDIIIANDPDCDRVGVVVKHNKKYSPLNGNQMGILLTDFILSSLRSNNTLPDNGVVIKTIVTTEMIQALAEEYSVEIMNVLTGFKYIAEKMREFDEKKNKKYIFGFEESYGYLFGDSVRDKDGVIASCLLALLAEKCKKENKTLIDKLNDLYEKYGFYKESLLNIVMPGVTGAEQITQIMKYLRENVTDELADFAIKEKYDILEKKYYDVKTNKEGEYDCFPKSNVLKFVLENENTIIARPSGTEPKIKFYFGVKCDNEEKCLQELELMKTRIENLINKITT